MLHIRPRRESSYAGVASAIRNGPAVDSVSDLDEYMRLVHLAETSPGSSSPVPEVRVAVLGDHATQRLCKLIKACLIERGYRPLLYEGSFDAISLETLAPALKEFQPEFIYIATCVQRVRERYLGLTPEARLRVSEVYAEEIRQQVLALSKPGRVVMINTLALPIERQYGNYSLLSEQSFYGIIVSLNRLIVEVARQTGAFLNDIMYLAARVGGSNFFDDRFWSLSKLMCRNHHLPRIAQNVGDLISTLRGRVVKCLVLDLDNTLWGGQIGDDGLEGIALGDTGVGEAFRRFQQYLLSLRDRGLLLAVCSKNDLETARLPFRQHPHMVLKEEHFSVFIANWKPKAENIAFIAKTLNIGIDSLMVIDDSPFERGEIRSRHPMAQIPELPADNLDWIWHIEENNYLETTALSSTDRDRATFYQQESEREAEFLQYDNIEQYLRSLEMVLSARTFDRDILPRVAQLLTRSNQFNLRTQRYTLKACESFAADVEHYLTLAVSLKDRFGDYGIIAAACCEWQEEQLAILELAVSCRAFKRGVENAILDLLVESCKRRKIARIWGEYLPTAKNGMVRGFYEEMGFTLIDADSSGRRQYQLSVIEYTSRPNFFLEVVRD